MTSYARTHENRSRLSSAIASLAILAIVFGAAGCSKLKARDQLNKGVAAFKNGKYDDSIENFKQAKDLDPNLINARLYLATAYTQEYIPGAPSDDNVKVGEQAIKEFQDVLSMDPNNLSAIDGIGSMYYNMAGTPFAQDKFDQSKQFNDKHISIKPDDPEPYYWVGVIDWQLAFRANEEARQAYNVDAKKKINPAPGADPLPDKLRDDYTQKYNAMVDEGLKDLEKAIELRPDYADAMAYESLVLRLKADQSDNATRDTIEKQADDLLDKVKEIKQKQAEEAATKSS
jgi:tetratricopeptide (TPR) repeat protein